MPRFVRSSLLALALVAAAGLSAAAAEIRIDNFTFSPQTLTVAQGTTITWVNRDDTPHRLAGTANQFKSPVLDTDETFTWTAAEPGKVAYFCTMHPHMTGTIVVTAK